MSAGLPDPERLRTWLLGNLAGYGTTLTEQVHAGIRDGAHDAPTFGESVAWILLGPARLHVPPWAELA